jgi:hypothetical protein
VIAVNKWDTIPVKTDKTLSDYEADVRAQVSTPCVWTRLCGTVQAACPAWTAATAWLAAPCVALPPQRC